MFNLFKKKQPMSSREYNIREYGLETDLRCPECGSPLKEFKYKGILKCSHIPEDIFDGCNYKIKIEKLEISYKTYE